MDGMQTGQPKGGNKLSDGFGFIYWVISVVALCFTPFVRCEFGAEGIGINGLFALVVMLLYAGLAESQGVVVYIVAWLVVVAYRRLQGFLRARRGFMEHSLYSGRPWLSMKIVKSEMVAKALIDPLVCAVVGLGLMLLSQPLGQLLCNAVSVALLLKGTIEGHVYRLRVRRMRDSHIENMRLAEGLRN